VTHRPDLAAADVKAAYTLDPKAAHKKLPKLCVYFPNADKIALLSLKNSAF
jgi:hypothetical protein